MDVLTNRNPDFSTKWPWLWNQIALQCRLPADPFVLVVGKCDTRGCSLWVTHVPGLQWPQHLPGTKGGSVQQGKSGYSKSSGILCHVGRAGSHVVLALNRILKQASHLYFNAHPRPNTHVQGSEGVSLRAGKKTAKQLYKEQLCSQNS